MELGRILILAFIVLLFIVGVILIVRSDGFKNSRKEIGVQLTALSLVFFPVVLTYHLECGN